MARRVYRIEAEVLDHRTDQFGKITAGTGGFYNVRLGSGTIIFRDRRDITPIDLDLKDRLDRLRAGTPMPERAR